MAQPALMNTYGRLPVAFQRGDGVHLYDTEGRTYLDAIAGLGVCALGHSHPAVTEAITAQASNLLHTSNLYHIKLQEDLAHAVCRVSGMERVFFGNSGAEANEAAIKLARLHGHRNGIKNPHIIVMDKAFHGRTMATLTASGNRKIQAGFEPLVSGFARAPFGDIKALKKFSRFNSKICAVMLEPIQGEGGVNVLPEGYLRELRALCDERGWLLILDEVQTGNARTGTWYAYQQLDASPDIVTTAKGLGNGVPVGACMARGQAAELFQPGNHGTTFGGNPLACAASLAVINTIEKDSICGNAAAQGHYLRTELEQRIGKLPHVKNIRGMGMMLGIELTLPCKGLVEQALAEGLLINVTADTVVRLLPPLIYRREHAQQLLDTLCPLITAWPDSAARAS